MDEVAVAQIPMEMAGQWHIPVVLHRRQKQEDLGDLLASLGSQ